MAGKIKSTINNLKGKEELVVAISPTALVLSTYLLLLLTKVIDLTLINRDNEYLSVILLQMLVFLVPAAIWCRFNGEKYTKGLRIRAPKPNTLILIVAASLLMMSGGILLSMLFGSLDELSNNFSLYDTFVSKDDGTIPVKLYLILAYAALPAVCEEFVFRGILCYEYEKGGVARAIILSSLFFGLLHFNVRNLPVYLLAGAILALVMYATRSLIGAVICHFLYNLFGLFGQPYIATFYKITSSTELFFIVLGIIFFVSGTVFSLEAARIYKSYMRNALSADYRKPEIHGADNIKKSYLNVLTRPSAIACFILYIIVVIISMIF